jgi:predicted RNase H-like HicB family nuclease
MVRLKRKNPVSAQVVRQLPSPRVAASSAAKPYIARTADSPAYQNHPLAKTTAVSVDIEFDRDAKTFVTHVKELHGMSTYGDTELAALENTAEMIRGYLKSMQAHNRKIPLSQKKLTELKRIVGIA